MTPSHFPTLPHPAWPIPLLGGLRGSLLRGALSKGALESLSRGSLAIFFLPLLLLAGCVTESTPADTRHGNFEALWSTIDRHYCFFAEKQADYGLDWNEVHTRYAPQVAEGMTSRQLFEVLANMLCELRDGHVNLYAAHQTASYGEWFDAYPANFSDSLLRATLGPTGAYAQASGLRWRVLPDNVGYVRVSSFDVTFGLGNLQEMMRDLATCSRLVVDVRSNGGGMLTSATRLASLFVNEETVGAYMAHKTGTAHTAFSPPEPIRITPFHGLRWQKPVSILTNRRTFSAANTFVMMLKGLPRVTIVGDRTGGGAGMPFSSELPNGWSVRFSACPMYDRTMQCTESGIDPDIRVDIAPDDLARGIDTILERAKKE